MLTICKHIGFDYAIKRILREKANIGILEGFLTTLFDEPVQIIELLESKNDYWMDVVRTDARIRKSNGEAALVEIRLIRTVYYYECIHFGAEKAKNEHISIDRNVKDVYSVNIFYYFDFGKGEDYAYRGHDEFRGLTRGDSLKLTDKERMVLEMEVPDGVNLEYFLLRVDAFSKKAENYLEEWISYIKYDEIEESKKASGLQEAAEKLQCKEMTEAEWKAYDRYIDAIRYERSVIDTAVLEGKVFGYAEGLILSGVPLTTVKQKTGLPSETLEGLRQGLKTGLEKGRAEQRKGLIEMARKMKSNNMPIEMIKQYSGLSDEDIKGL